MEEKIKTPRCPKHHTFLWFDASAITTDSKGSFVSGNARYICDICREHRKRDYTGVYDFYLSVSPTNEGNVYKWILEKRKVVKKEKVKAVKASRGRGGKKWVVKCIKCNKIGPREEMMFGYDPYLLEVRNKEETLDYRCEDCYQKKLDAI